MFMPDQPTPFDLRFRLLGFPVRVHPLFWLIMALLGDRTLQNELIGPFALVLWVACGFVSIMIHELGHALMIRRFGSPSEIVLFGFGGYATMPYPPTRASRRLIIALAGPIAGFLFLAVLVGSQLLLGWASLNPYLNVIFGFLFWMNLVWNIINLLPIWPLDGGRALREICEMAGARHPDRIALSVSVLVAGVLALYGIASALRVPVPLLDALIPFRPSMFMSFWLIMLAIENYQMLQVINRRTRGWDDDRSPWER